MTLELPWSADKAIQQFGKEPPQQPVAGRCTRSWSRRATASAGSPPPPRNSSSPRGVTQRPQSPRRGRGPPRLRHRHQGGIRRWADIDDARREKLGSHAQRPGRGDFKRARSSLGAVWCPWGWVTPTGLKATRGSCPKGSRARSRLFLNRLMGLSVDQQKLLFAYFTETHEAEVAEAKARGTFDEGVVSLSAESVAMSDGYPRVVHTDVTSGATTELCRITIDDRG